MNVTDYTYLMNKPDAITEKHTDALGSVLIEFPYFQSARALRLKGLYSQNSFKYNYALKVTAAHTADRSVLFDFITSETYTAIQAAYYDKKLKELLQINVVDSEIILPAEIKKTSEVKIDPIEKSILDSIKEATNVTFEKAVIVEKTETETVPEQPIVEAIKKIEAVTFEEPIVKVIEIKTDPIAEQSILEAIKKIETVTFEEPSKIEETKIDPAVEQSILDAVKTIETVTFEEPEKIEIKIEPVIDQSVLDAVKTIESVTFEEPSKIEEPKTEEPEIKAVEEDVLTAIKEMESTIPEVRVDDIEQSELTSMEEASTVVFEEVKTQEAEEITEPVKAAIEHLEIGKPLDFSLNEKHSFQEWLQLSRTEPIDRSNEVFTESTSEEKEAQIRIEDEERRKKEAIINKFIETNPKIPPIKPTAITPAVQLDANKDEDNSYLMTETLARVYLEQKKYTKAIQAYEILILKYPEKISFFADRIADIKILQQNNNNNN